MNAAGSNPLVAARGLARPFGACYRVDVPATREHLPRFSPKPERRPRSAPQPLDDAALIARLVAGDEAALGELYDRHATLLMAVGLRILKDRREAEDLLHDVFVEAWRRAADFDPARGGVRAWLVTRTRSRALDRCKSPGRLRAVPLDPLAEERLGSSDDRSAPADGADHDRLRRAVAMLSPEQRAVLECAYFDGLSSSESAARLQIPVGTVKSRMAAGLSKLRVALGAP